jgi:putative peptidoglycan lipid II flippase
MRTPALINVAMVATKIAVVTLSVATLPSQAVVVTLPVASSLSYLIGAVCGHRALRARYGLLGFHAALETFTRVLWASVVAGLFCVASVGLSHRFIDNPRGAAAITLLAAATFAVPAFLLAARTIGVPEVRRARSLLFG